MLTISQPLMRISGKKHRGDISERKSRVSTITGSSIEKDMHVYGMWYRYLQLALELEKMNIPILTPKGNIKVNVKRHMYKGWDIESVLEHTFRDETDWWKHHTHLFTQELVVEITSIEEIDFSTSHRYFKISTEKKVSEVVRELKFLLEQQKKGKKAGKGKTAEYTTTGEVRYYAYRDAYSALIMKINGKSDTEISKFLYANDVRKKGERMIDKKKVGDEEYFSRQKMRDTLNLAKRAVLSVSDGYFPKNPNKTYF
jgi:hypothetical protein